VNCQLKCAGGGGTLSEAVGVADHYTASSDASHFGDDRRWIWNMMQYAKRHYDTSKRKYSEVL